MLWHRLLPLAGAIRLLPSAISPARGGAQYAFGLRLFRPPGGGAQYAFAAALLPAGNVRGGARRSADGDNRRKTRAGGLFAAENGDKIRIEAENARCGGQLTKT